MPIACQSELRATPNTIDLPGSTELSLDLLAAPASATADVDLVLEDEAPVFFADGSKRERLTLAVSAAGTSMRHRARLISRGGMSAQAFTVRATVFENGIFRCARACTIGVAGVTQRSGAAKAKRATKKKSPAKTPARRKRR